MGNLIDVDAEEAILRRARVDSRREAGPPCPRPGGGPGWYASQPAALRRDFERDWRAARGGGGAEEEGCRHGCDAQAPAGTRELEEPLAPASATEYLREILTCEESLTAAFQPVLRAARCACPEGIRVVDRGAFAQAVVRISAHFNPSEPVVLRMSSAGPPLSSEEALGHFRMALCLLADRLGEGQGPARLLAPHAAGATGSAPREGAIAAGAGGAAPPRSARPQEAEPARAPQGAGASVVAAYPARRSPGTSLGAIWASPLEEQEHDETARALSASRERVRDLHRRLAREEELLAHQGEEVQRLERLERDLEGHRTLVRRARSGTPPLRRRRAQAGRCGPRARPGCHAGEGGAGGCAQFDLGSLKQTVTAARLLRARMEALEMEAQGAGARDLDDREGSAAELSDEP